MGSIYMEHVVGIPNPRVAIVNIGAEEEKGNALVKETFPLLKECKDINFIGSIEAREIPHGGADVIVCEAFKAGDDGNAPEQDRGTSCKTGFKDHLKIF